MRQRRVRINPAIKSSYNASWKNHCETAPHKIKPKLSMNMEQEHRKNPLRALSSITDKTLYGHDFEAQVEKIAKIRQIMDDRKNGKEIKQRGKKPHIDMTHHAPTSRS